MNHKYIKFSSKLLRRSIRELTTSVKCGNSQVAVFGGSILDVNYRILDEELCLNGGSYKSKIEYSPGGVARNLAENLYKIHGNVQLVSAFGDDSNGITLKKSLPSECLHYSITIPNQNTATCAIILDKCGDSKLFVGEMSIHSEITPDLILKHKHLFKDSPLIVMDSNLSHEAIELILKLAVEFKKPVFFEPTDLFLAKKPFELPKSLYQQIKFISPNLQELRTIAKILKVPGVLNIEPNNNNENNLLNEICEICLEVQDHVENIIVTMGELGVFISRRATEDREFFDANVCYKTTVDATHYCRHYPAIKEEHVVSVSGAGDAFSAGFISAMLRQLPENICVSVGFQASKEALRAKGAVPEKYFSEDHKCWKAKSKHDLVMELKN